MSYCPDEVLFGCRMSGNFETVMYSKMWDSFKIIVT